MESKSIPGIIIKLQNMVDEAKERINAPVKISKNITSNFYGYEFKIDDIDIWFGIEYDVWSEEGCPIIIWIENFDKVNTKLQKFEKYNNDAGDVKIYCFRKEELEDTKGNDKDAVNTIVDKIKELIDTF